jgi:hypothetical protein
MSEHSGRAFVWVPILLLFCGCGAPDEGTYTGKIGTKNVSIEVDQEGAITLQGYWQKPLRGSYDRGAYKGKDMSALVFEGPAGKKFKLRILYEEDGEEWVVHAVQSRAYGPGARYVPTEEDSVFSPPPRLSRKPSD